MTIACCNEVFEVGSYGAAAATQLIAPLQDDAANTDVADLSAGGHTGTFTGGANTEDATTAGPNSWLTKALAFDGTEHVTFGTGFGTAPSAFTLFAWVKHLSGTANSTIISRWDTGIGGTSKYYLFRRNNAAGTCQGFAYDGTDDSATFTGTSLADNAWHAVAFTFDGSTLRGWMDGTLSGTTGSSGGNSNTFNTNLTIARRNAAVSSDYLTGEMAGVIVRHDYLSDSELDEILAGLEPINSVDPEVSGTETNGATLSCDPGTWGLPSPFSGGNNGTIVYSYQWTRSTDATGTGETDIVGATSSTYVPIAVDIGKYLRCRVRASNTGGFDPAADTNSNFTGAIAAVSPQLGIPTAISTPTDGTYAWNNEDNLTNDGLSSAETDTAEEGDDLSYSVFATGFGLAIPDGATFDGLRVTLAGMHSNGGVNASNNVALIRPIIEGVQTGDDKGDAYQLSGTPEDKVYGGPTDKWGMGAITAAEWNSGDTGIRIQWGVNDGDSIVIDSVRYEVFYTAGSGEAGEQSAVFFGCAF